MKYGFSVATRGPLATADSLVAIARHGEEMGFDFVGVSDHIIIPKDIRSRYPYSLSGEFAGADPGECLEQLTVVAFLAAATSKIKLLTTVLVLPHRNPVHTAKVFASIDVLSGGRLIAGCGVGWMREEFEALGAPPFDRRGAVSDEYLKAFKELWSKDDPEFDGEFVSFRNVRFAPQPVQKPHPPIWIGGESPPALAAFRTARGCVVSHRKQPAVSDGDARSDQAGDGSGPRARDRSREVPGRRFAVVLGRLVQRRWIDTLSANGEQAANDRQQGPDCGRHCSVGRGGGGPPVPRSPGRHAGRHVAAHGPVRVGDNAARSDLKQARRANCRWEFRRLYERIALWIRALSEHGVGSQQARHRSCGDRDAPIGQQTSRGPRWC